MSFNSLQTGRHIQTGIVGWAAALTVGMFALKFQFPSNGKAHSDRNAYQSESNR